MQNLRKILYFMSVKERREAFILVGMFLIMALLDIIGVASIMPFIYVLTNPEIVETNSYLNRAFITTSIFGVKTTQQFLFFIGIFFFILLLVSLSFKALTTYLQTRFAQMRQYSIAKRLMEGYLNQPYTWFLNRHSADLGKSILSEVGIIVSSGLAPMLNVIAKSIIALGLLALIIVVNPKLAFLVFIIIGSAFGIIYKLSRNFLRRIGEDRVKKNQWRFTALTEAFGAVKEIKLGGLEQIYVQRFADAAKVIARHNASGKVISVLPRFAVEAIAFGGMILVALILILQKGTDDVIPLLALYAFAGYRLLPALQQIYSDITELRFIGPALDIMYDDLKSLKSFTHDTSKEVLPLKKSIYLNHVNYNYPNSSKLALKNIKINIPAFSTVGIVGATGSGKTTTVDIILGLLETKKGTLEVDGEVINKNNLRAWQRSIGYVPQQIYVSDDTIEANIAFGAKDSNDIDQEAVKTAAKIANLHEFVVNELQNKYKTTVGERGVRLSGGQRQRIGIARALYNKPNVLILDEATSALDNLTEQAVMDALQNLKNNITVVMIAHRLSTVKKCDNIFLLEKGELRGEGTFEKLMKENTNFRANVNKM